MSSRSPTDGQTPTATTDDGKRKAEPATGTQTRAKRNRYISLAWEFRSMKDRIERLQEQVNTLFESINGLHRQTESPAVDNTSQLSREASRSISWHQPTFETQNIPIPKPRTKHLRFYGPTSTAFNFAVAKSSLQTMGITHIDDGSQEIYNAQDATPTQTPPYHSSALYANSLTSNKDPLFAIKREEAIRLCRVYEDEIGQMYPMFDVEKMITQTNLLFAFLEAADRNVCTGRSRTSADCLNDDDTAILKIVLAITLLLEGNGQSELGTQLYISIKDKIETNLWEQGDLKMIKLLALVATYHFHTDDEVLAYRMVGLAARMCIEMGLHRRDAVLKTFHSPEDITTVYRIFWSVYTLDKRWAFGTGLPFVIQDEDIDPCLPEPDEGVPYLRAMVHYCRIASKVWYSGFGSKADLTVKKDRMGYLDYQIVEWMKHIPDPLNFYSVDNSRNSEGVNRSIQRLRYVLYIRGNHMRILIYRPVLHSATSIIENMAYAQTVVEIAKDTIRVLSELNRTTDIYRSQQILFNYFLVGALVVLFLAISHAPVKFNRQLTEEFHMALNLVKGFSTKSYISKRLWKMIKGLREVGERLGLLPHTLPTESADPHSTAAVAMAGLAGHSVDGISPYGTHQHTNGELGSSPMNGVQMSNELTYLFEAIENYNGYITTASAPDGMNGGGFAGTEHTLPSAGEALPVLGNEGEFSRIIQDLF
ncbi:TPA_exp: putative C6 transcription factor [Trichophyton benhamiae CBS 112371]|nr:TPA_exp: putative C6 transcription factor [Trichophyton benhamiae CBS 112371]